MNKAADNKAGMLKAAVCPPASLADFAKVHRSRSECWTCRIPEAEEINEGRRNNVPTATMMRWLQDVKGHRDVTRNKLDHHFQGRHHEKTA